MSMRRLLRVRVLVIALSAGLLVALGVIGVIFGTSAIGDGDDRLTLEEYFVEVEALVNTIDNKTEARQASSASEILFGWGIVLGETADSLTALKPPSELQRDHEELADAVTEGAVALGSLADQHPDVASGEEALRLRNEDPAVVAAFVRAAQACAKLQQAADDNGIKTVLELC